MEKWIVYMACFILQGAVFVLNIFRNLYSIMDEEEENPDTDLDN